MERRVKKLTTILLSGMIIGFTGCGSTGELPDGEAGDDTLYQGSVVPQVQEGVGEELEFQNYLYYALDRINKETYLYDEYSYYSLTTSLFIKSRDPQNNLVVTQTIDSKIISEDVVYNNKITSYQYDANEIVSLTIDYPLWIQKNELVSQTTINGETTTCIFQDFEANLNLEYKLPQNIFNDLNNRDTNLNLDYSNVIHVYCGATDGSTADIYYASEYGKVLSILKSTDKTSYEIVSKNKFYE